MKNHRLINAILLAFGLLMVVGIVAGLFLPAVGAREYRTLQEAMQSPATTKTLVLMGRGPHGTSITEVPSEVRQFVNLTHLELSCNNIHRLPDWLTENPKIIKIGLANNQLSAFPLELAKMPILKELNLNWNAIAKLPPSIGALTSLEDLELDGNQLTKLPPEIGNLKSLVFLDLGGNSLVRLPPDIGNLQRLERLNLAKNRLADLPEEISHLVSLKNLWLDGNCLSPETQARIRELLPHTNIDFGQQVGENIYDRLSPEAQAAIKGGQLKHLPAASR